MSSAPEPSTDALALLASPHTKKRPLGTAGVEVGSPAQEEEGPAPGDDVVKY